MYVVGDVSKVAGTSEEVGMDSRGLNESFYGLEVNVREREVQ